MNVIRDVASARLKREFSPCLGKSDTLPTLLVPTQGPKEKPDFVGVFQKLIDGLPEQIALLDDEWQILAINKAWVKTAALYGYSALRPGTNYFEFLRDMATLGHNAAKLVVEGILDMARGGADSFNLSYAGSDQWEGHTFHLRLNQIEIENRKFFTVTRYDVTELMQLRRLREGYSFSLIEGQAEERRKMAREIHDSTAQLLAGLGLTLAQLKRTRRSNRTMEIVLEMEQLLAEAQREIRSISYLTHPPHLSERGLTEALRKLTDGYARRTDLAIHLNIVPEQEIAWPVVEAAIYRLVQEALSNIHRHAKATEVHVGIYVRQTTIHAVIADNGVGIAPDAALGVGIPGMRTRFRELGGRLRVRATYPGTVVIASVPREPSISSTEGRKIRP
jgi:two-component system NarL family sensor kinase